VELVEQVGVGLEPGQVALGQVEGEPAVGDHPVPVGQQVVLGHRRQAGQVGLLEAIGLDPGQPVAVPGRGRLGHPEQVAQAVSALLAQPLGRPAQPLDVLGHEGRQVGQVSLPEVQLPDHGRGPGCAGRLAGRADRRAPAGARGDRPGQLAVAELMGDAFRAMAGHWERIEQAAGGWGDRTEAARAR
jgi:hypothetical protein